MKNVYVIILIIGAMMPLFQNCGMDAANKKNTGLYIGTDNPDCLSAVVDCGPKPQYLEITIDLSNPSVFPASNSSFVVYGRCNEGNYDKTAIRYSAYDATDLETPKITFLKQTGDSSGNCRNGRYFQTIDIRAAAGYSVSTAYVLKVEMLAYDPETDALIHNDQSNGSSIIDFSKE